MELLLILSFWLFACPGQVRAYLDPGSGSYMLQILAGLGITAAYFFISPLKRFLVKLKNIFHKINEPSVHHQSEQ